MTNSSMEIYLNIDSDIENLDINLIKRNVGGKHPTIEYEMEFIRRITLVEKCILRKQAENYFLGDFSVPILNYVSLNLYRSTYYQEILGDYYEFISKTNNKTPYYKLALYKNINNSTLRNYVLIITTRHFVSKKKKDDKLSANMISIEGSTIIPKEKENDLIDNPWFNLLIGNNGTEDEEMDLNIVSEKIEYVLSKLPERDVKIIRLMVMDDYSGLEAFEELKDDLALTAKIPVSTWSKKQKQDAMSLQRGRALKHFNKIVKDEKINF